MRNGQRTAARFGGLFIAECDSAIGEGFFEPFHVGSGWIKPDDSLSVPEAGGGMFDSFDSDKNVVNSQRAGFAVEPFDRDFDTTEPVV